MEMRPGTTRKVEVIVALVAMAISGWVVLSVLVMAGMRGAYGSSPAGERIRLWQYLNFGIVLVLQIAATVLLVRLSNHTDSTGKRIAGDGLGSEYFQESSWHKYARAFLASTAITTALALAMAAIRN